MAGAAASLEGGLPRWPPRRSGTCLDGVGADKEAFAWSSSADVLAGDKAESSSILAGVPLNLPLALVEGAPFSLCFRVRRTGIAWDISSGVCGIGE